MAMATGDADVRTLTWRMATGDANVPTLAWRMATGDAEMRTVAWRMATGDAEVARTLAWYDDWRCGHARPSRSADVPTWNTDLPLDDTVCGRPSRSP